MYINKHIIWLKGIQKQIRVQKVTVANLDAMHRCDTVHTQLLFLPPPGSAQFLQMTFIGNTQIQGKVENTNPTKIISWHILIELKHWIEGKGNYFD